MSSDKRGAGQTGPGSHLGVPRGGETVLRIFRRDAACRVLGPGTRAVLWVQGCTLACPGCLVPKSWSKKRADTVELTVEAAADWILACDVDGVTLSGGEPMQQALALGATLARVRQQRDVGVVCYTGYRYEQLREHGALLRQVDLLIDGPYRVDLHADLLWRASSNQRLLPLTDRYRHLLPKDARMDRSVGLEWQIQPDGRFAFAGVPPWPDYVGSLMRP